jgi:hypothetical protein
MHHLCFLLDNWLQDRQLDLQLVHQLVCSLQLCQPSLQAVPGLLHLNCLCTEQCHKDLDQVKVRTGSDVVPAFGSDQPIPVRYLQTDILQPLPRQVVFNRP